MYEGCVPALDFPHLGALFQGYDNGHLANSHRREQTAGNLLHSSHLTSMGCLQYFFRALTYLVPSGDLAQLKRHLLSKQRVHM